MGLTESAMIGTRVSRNVSGQILFGRLTAGPAPSQTSPGDPLWAVTFDGGGQGTARSSQLNEVGTEPGTGLIQISLDDAGIGSFPGIPGSALLTQVEPGADLRDLMPTATTPGIETPPFAAGGGAVVLVSRLLPMLPAAGQQVIKVLARGSASGLTLLWDSLPGPVRALMQLVGFGGAALVIDQVFFGGDGDGLLPAQFNTQIVGSWEANGVTFYRLSDGRLAVQNKKGRWKVWRPKKPIVLMPTGAVDLRTLLRADAVLNKQSKRIAAMLNRRAPRRSRAKGGQNPDQIVVIDGKAVKTS